MAIKPVIFSTFEGGIASDQKIGIANSAANIQAFDFRKAPSQLSVLPRTRREDSGVVKDLVVNEVIAPDGTIYAWGNQGYLYKRTTAGAWSEIGKATDSGYGLDYRIDTTALYATSTKTVSSYKNSTWFPDLYASSHSTYDNTANMGFNVAAYQAASTQTTTLATSISENSTALRYFQTDIEPLIKVSVFVVARGTGNWTVTLHDGLNNSLGSKTISNASLNNNDWNDFTFSSQVRVYPAPNARTYHIHITSTVADGTVQSSKINDMSTCDLRVYADRLIATNNSYHPIERFLQYECIGNGNYLSVWEPISDVPTNDEWKRHKLVFPSEYEVCGLAVLNEYLAIACERSNGNSTFNSKDGIIFWWDGLSPTYNYFTRIPEGGPYAIHEYQNIVYYYAGGAWYAVAGANSVPQKVRTMPGTDTEFSQAAAPIRVHPYMATTRRGTHLMGFPSSTTNTSINYGVYSWGAVDKNFPQSFGYNYLVSTGSQNYSASNNLQIGSVRAFGDILHISWRDDLNGSYGVDVVDNTSGPAPFATWESLIFDNGYVAKLKAGVSTGAYFQISSGVSVYLKYKIDRGSWVYSPAYTTTNQWMGQANYARLSITNNNGGRFHEIQIGIDMYCDSTVTTSPSVQMLSLVFDDAQEERDMP